MRYPLPMNLKTLSLLACICALPGTVPAADAIQNIQPLNSSGFSYGETGFRFRVGTNVTVTSLGYFFRSAPGPSTYIVRLLDGNGTELRSSTNSALAAATDQLVHTAIDPIQLLAGTTNTLQAYDALYASTNSGVKRWEGYAIDARASNTGTFTVAPEIQYLGAVTNGLPYYGDATAPFTLLVGPNLSFPTGSDAVRSSLTITLISATTARVSWPLSDVPAVLQSATNISTVWTNVSQAVSTNGGSREVDVPVVPPGAYFRLKYD